MNVRLTDSERRQLQQWQKQWRDNDGYVKVTVLLLLDKGRSAGSIADDLGLDQATVYRYAAAFAELGLSKYLAHEQPGYWGLRTSGGKTVLGQVEFWVATALPDATLSPVLNR